MITGINSLFKLGSPTADRNSKFGRQPLSLNKLRSATGVLLGGLSRLLDSWSGLTAVVVVEGRWNLQVRTRREQRRIDLRDDQRRRKRNPCTESSLSLNRGKRERESASVQNSFQLGCSSTAGIFLDKILLRIEG